MVTTAKTAQLRNWFGHRPSWKQSAFCLAIAFTLCNLSANNSATAATYYLDAVNGSDTNAGDSAHPWKTLDRAYTWYSGEGNKVQEGDTVYFRNGSYGTFRENTDDNPPSKYHFHRTNWVIYKAASGHTPTFSSITVNNADHASNPFTPGESYLWFEGISIPSGFTYFQSTNYIKLINCNIAGPVITIPGACKSYYITDNHNLVYGNEVNDLTIQGCNLSLGYRAIQQVNAKCKRWTIHDCNISDFAEVGAMVTGDDYSYTNNVMKRIGGTSNVGSGWPLLGTMNNVFEVNEVVIQSTTGATGVYYKTSGTQYYIYQTSATNFAATYTVTGQNSGATLTNTSITGMIHSAMIYGNKCNNLTIANNIFASDDYLALYGDGGAISNLQFNNNLMYGNRAAGKDFVFISGVTSGDFSNNTIICPAAVRLDVSHDYRNVVIDTMYNNIITYFSQNADHIYTSQVVSHGNNIFGNNPNGPISLAYPFVFNGTELVNYNINSLFVNAANNDFNLAPNSAAINFGNRNYGPSSDILGHSRSFPPDAGCYEYVVESNKPPNADAGQDQAVPDSDQSGSAQVTLDGSSSSDPDGSIVSYIWSESGKQIATGVRPTVTLSVGRHIITLQVTDNSGLTDTDTVVITIEVEEGLVGQWKFEDGSGLYANDSSGYSITGRLVNNPLWTTQGEISFDGNNDAVEINTATLNISSGTVALWVNPREFSKSKHYLFGHLTQPANNRIQLFCNASGTLGVGLGDNASLNTNIQTLNTQEWYHIALTWSNTSYAVFVDGQQKASGTFGGISAVQTYADIGNSGNRSQLSEAFYGLIDEVRLYNRALSADEVADHALVFLPIGNKTIDEGETLTFPVKTNFGNIVDISDSNLPHIPSFASNVFTWTPNYDDAGTYEVEFTAPHGSGEDFERITVTVMDTQQEEPVGYWKFDETSGDIAADASISDNTGYLENGLTWDSGEFNGSVVFSVPNDAVEIKTTNFSANSGTISMWVDVERLTLSRHYLFGHSDSKLNNRIQLYLKYGNLCLGLGNSNTTSMNIQLLEYHKWYHICLTWSRTTYGVYVDGLRKANGTFRGLTGFADHADIGNNGTTRDKGLNGRIDNVRIYNRVLDANEITELALGQ